MSPVPSPAPTPDFGPKHVNEEAISSKPQPSHGLVPPTTTSDNAEPLNLTGNASGQPTSAERQPSRPPSSEEEVDEPDCMVTSETKPRSVPIHSAAALDFSKHATDMYDCDTIYKHKLLRHRKLPLSDDSGMNSSGALDLTDRVDVKVENFLGVHNQSISRLGTPDSSPLNETSDMEEGTNEVQVHPGLNVMSSMSMPLSFNIDQVLDEEKNMKRKTRQEIDPGKYFEAVDGSGTKYACSQCGNIYKWRKSLNKHWKEKHLKDPLVEETTGPGMLELLKSGKYTQLGARRVYNKAFLATIKTQKADGNNSPPSSSGSNESNPSPPNFLSTPQSIQNSIKNSINARLAASGMLGLPHLAMPNYPLMPLDNNALDLRQDMVNQKASFPGSPAPQEMETSFDQDAPLDFSKKISSPNKESTVVKSENVYMKLSSPTNPYYRNDKRDSPYASSEDEPDMKRARHDAMNSVMMNPMMAYGNTKKTPVKEQYSPGSTTSSGSWNEELPYKCTQCNFHARWPSEVTQHMKNHSDSKPYLCPRCDYRSKWKWDVVKHLKRCGGGGGIDEVIDTTKSKKDDVPTTPGGPPNAIVSQQGKIKKTTLQPPMPYIMPSLDAAYSSGQGLPSPIPSATFIPIAPSKPMTSPSSSMASSTFLCHSTPLNHSNSQHNSSSEIINRFKCLQCKMYFPHLQGLMDHRSSVHIGKEDASPETVAEEIDAARIKHPRKPIKQIQCAKCDFVCRNRQTMDRHMEEHEQKEMNILKCFYCTLQFKNKETLLDHIISHPTFNPKEWETFFMMNEEDEEEINKSIKSETDDLAATLHSKDDQPIVKTKESKPEATDARIPQNLDEIPKQRKPESNPSQLSPSVNKYKCEWCPEEFINLTAVYKHASLVHPIQLKEQDVSQASQAGQDFTPKRPISIDLLCKQIADKTNQQIMEKRHYELHDSKQQFPCWYKPPALLY